MKSLDYLDQVKKKLDLPSDYALAKVLGITSTAVGALRASKSAMGIETALKVGEILDVDGHEIYAAGQIERARSPEIRQFWVGVVEKFSTSFNALISCADPRRTPRPA